MTAPQEVSSPVPMDERTMITKTTSKSAVRAELDLREHSLLQIEGGQPGQRIPFGPTPLKLGRKAVCDVVLVDSEVSSQHCEVQSRGTEGDAQVTDLQSTNGTFINGKRIQGAMRLANGALLQIGTHVFKHEFRLPSEIAQSAELDRELEKANRYVQSLLPPPLQQGPIRTDWVYQPSTQLGGDAFGYHQLDEHTFAAYLIDVSGHGAGAAMHSVSVMNVLRQRALPGTDFSVPQQVLTRLNDLFQMESHAGMYFSIWYGVFNAQTRTLCYASGGHHASYLIAPDSAEWLPLKTKNLVIGAMPEISYRSDTVSVPANSRLYIFSDGVFEVVTKTGEQWDLPDFLPLLQSTYDGGGGQADRIYRSVLDIAREGPLDDDFSLLVVTFV